MVYAGAALLAILACHADNTAQDGDIRRAHASAILARAKTGAVRFVNPGRDLPQIKSAAAGGKTLGELLLRAVDRLAARSTPRNPLVIMSLYRSASTAHQRGGAVDIRGFGGITIDSRTPHRGLPGVLRILDVLAPGRYSLGLPKPPNSDPLPLLPPPKTVPNWPYFPGPLPRLIYAKGRLVVAPEVRNGRMVPDRKGRLKPHILKWPNERGAPRADLGSPELRRALADAEQRGIRFRSLFPDALDHLHLEVH